MTETVSEVLQTLPAPPIPARLPDPPLRELELPRSLLDDRARIERDGRTCSVRTATPIGYRDCPNCAGVGWLMLQEIIQGPYSTPGRKTAPEQRLTWIDNGWYVVENHYYECPVCGDPAARREILWRNCGLEPNEKHWRVDFLAGREGKSNAHAVGLEILASIPNVVGWFIFHGDYGRGKSGLMKSIVAQSVMAGVTARYIHAAAILSEIRSTFRDGAQLCEEEILGLYGNYQLLAIDEIEKIPDTGWATSTLMQVFETRYNRRHRAATLLGTNEDPEAMPMGFGYLQSRMRDGLRVLVGGVDLRGQQ